MIFGSLMWDLMFLLMTSSLGFILMALLSKHIMKMFLNVIKQQLIDKIKSTILERQLSEVYSVSLAVQRSYIKSFTRQIKELYEDKDNSSCITDKSKKCKANSNIIILNIQFYELLIHRIFNETIKAVIEPSLAKREYCDYSTEKYSKMIIDKFNYQVKVNRDILWPNPSHIFKITTEERTKYLINHPHNVDCDESSNSCSSVESIAMLQIITHCKIIYNETNRVIDNIDDSFVKNPFSILSNVVKYSLDEGSLFRNE